MLLTPTARALGAAGSWRRYLPKGSSTARANRMWPPSIACLFQRLAIGCRGKAVLRRDWTEQPIELVL